jgi:acyl carrier protein
MLTGEPMSVEKRVLELVAETCGLECSELSPASPLSEALDSLTLVAVVVRIEALFAVVLAGDELFSARDVGELVRLIARKIQHARESP